MEPRTFGAATASPRAARYWITEFSAGRSCDSGPAVHPAQRRHVARAVAQVRAPRGRRSSPRARAPAAGRRRRRAPPRAERVSRAAARSASSTQTSVVSSGCERCSASRVPSGEKASPPGTPVGSASTGSPSSTTRAVALLVDGVGEPLAVHRDLLDVGVSGVRSSGSARPREHRQAPELGAAVASRRAIEPSGRKRGEPYCDVALVRRSGARRRPSRGSTRYSVWSALEKARTTRMPRAAPVARPPTSRRAGPARAARPSRGR